MGSVQAGAVTAVTEPSPRASEVRPGQSQESESAEAPLARKLRPWFILLLVFQLILLAIRWRLGDAHGALLMFAVCAVGVLALTAGSSNSGVDAIYGGYFGLMAFVSGLLDLNLAIESIIWSEWQHWHKSGMAKEEFPSVAKPAIYIVCSAAQLASAFVAYFLYKESEDEMESEEPLLATQEQARIYNSIVSHGERVVFARQQQQQTSSPAGQNRTKAFAGSSHKLPPTPQAAHKLTTP